MKMPLQISVQPRIWTFRLMSPPAGASPAKPGGGYFLPRQGGVRHRIPFPARLSLLLKGGNPLGGVLTHGDRGQPRLQPIEGGIEVEIGHAVEGVPAEHESGRALRLQGIDDLVHHPIELDTGHDAGDGAETLSLVSVDQTTGQHQLEGGLARHHPGQEGRDHHRPQPYPDLGSPQLGVVDADRHVTGDGEPESTGECMAVDPGHSRLTTPKHQPEQVGEDSPRPVQSDRVVDERARQVAAGRERLIPGTGVDQDTHGRIIDRPPRRREESLHCLHRQRVAARRIRQRDRCPAFPHFVLDQYSAFV